MVKTTQKLFFIILLGNLASCASTTSKQIDVSTGNNKEHKVDGFASESVREAYLRLKKKDYTDQDRNKDVEESARIAKTQSKSMITGAATIDGAGQYKGKTYFLQGAEELNLENNYFDIPVVYNDQVKKWMDYFLNRGRGFFERYTERAGRYAPILGAILEEHGLPRDLIFLAMAESGFNTSAKSFAAAVGPWQFMPSTGRLYGLEQDWYKDERRDPIKATVAAARYLTKLYGDFGSWEVAAAAYNAGEGKLSKAIIKYKSEDFWDISKGRYLKDETKNYVPKIMALAIIGKNLKSFGFDDVEFHEPLDFDEVTVKPGTDLVKLSENLGVEFEEIQRLNPEVLRWFTPPNAENYKLRIPPNTAEKYAQCCSKLNLVATDFQEFVVTKKRMSVAEIAKKFKIRKTYVLSSLNKVSENATFAKGESIKLPFRLGETVSPSNNLYADLYEKPRREVLRKNHRNRTRIARSVSGKKSVRYYTVKKGESLFTVAQKHGISVKRLIASNTEIKKSRKVSAGDKLVIK
ncbi:MAG: transglycosylase SLT domain-containing protein [Bacteriovorax sp.]